MLYNAILFIDRKYENLRQKICYNYLCQTAAPKVRMAYVTI